MVDPGDFLARWSRLKRRAQAGPGEMAARSGTARPTLDETAAQPEPAAAPVPAVAAAQPQIADPAEVLPPVEALGRDSDYTPFMRPDVPDALRNEALRKLWQSDPIFANLDGLLEYGEDFGASFKLGGAVATVYRVLEGMPGPPEERPEKPAQPAESGPPTAAGPAGEAAAGAPETTLTTRNSRSRDGTRECELDEVVELDEHIDLD